MPRRFQQLLCAPYSGPKDPLQGRRTGLLGEPSAERAWARRRVTGKALQRERLAKMRLNPSHQQHHLSGSPIVPFVPGSSAGCAICDVVIALWCFAGAPSLSELKTRLAGRILRPGGVA